MSVNLMSAIFEVEFFDLRDEEGNTTKASTAKLVLLAMADHANDEGEGAYPSVERLARKTALSEQTIRNTFGALRYNGIIFLEGKSKHGTNNHTINTTCFPRAKEKEVTCLTLKPVAPLTGEVLPSNRSPVLNVPVVPESSITTKETSLADMPIEWKLAHGQEVTEDELAEERLKDEAVKMFEKAFGTGQWPWWSNSVWTKFAKFVVGVYQSDRYAFGNYVVWRGEAGKYSGFSNRKIRENPQAFMDTGWPEFEATRQNKSNFEQEYL